MSSNILTIHTWFSSIEYKFVYTFKIKQMNSEHWSFIYYFIKVWLSRSYASRFPLNGNRPTIKRSSPDRHDCEWLWAVMTMIRVLMWMVIPLWIKLCRWADDLLQKYGSHYSPRWLSPSLVHRNTFTIKICIFISHPIYLLLWHFVLINHILAKFTNFYYSI